MVSYVISLPFLFIFFFFNDTATTEIYTLSLHDALPIFQLDELGRRRAARQRLEAERPRSGEQIEHPGAAHRALQDAEPRLAHPVGGGPHGIARGSLQATTFELAGDDADHERQVRNAECGMRNC